MAELRGDPAGYELAFVEAKRALAEQADVLKEARDRVGTVVSAAAVVAGLGAAFALDAGAAADLSGWGATATVVAALGVALVTVAAAAIWRPLAGAFVIDAGILVGRYLETDPPASLVEMHRELAVHLARHADRNAEGIEARLRWFNRALFGFVGEVAALMLVLVDLA